VSSSYYILCASHDPALRIEHEYNSADVAFAHIEAGLDDHPVCDLLVARVSGALVDVGCPPTRDQRHHPQCLGHGGPMWARADLLRLLVAVRNVDDQAVREAAGTHAFACWTVSRLHRLRFELDTPALLVLDPAGGRP
jgi:hypothetical protein